MPPSQQRLKAADPVVLEDRKWDGSKLEFVLLDRVAQVELQNYPPGLKPGVHFRFEKAPCSTPVRLGAVKRHIRALEQLVRK